jgi:hypothetical protein
LTDPLLENFYREALPLLRQFCVGVYGMALGGSLAKGVGDEYSDIDIYLFARQVLPAEQRAALIQANPLFESVISWGGGEPFVEGGTDFSYAGRKVEVWLRNSDPIEATLSACLNGQIERACVVWTVMGFFNYTALSDLRVMKILDDPHGLLQGWKNQVAEYPPRLREAILQRFGGEAQFWPENFHYLSAIERGDVLYTSGIVQQVVQALIQVVFALNRVYFPGEKKLGSTLAHLALQPPDFHQRLCDLVYPGDDGSTPRLRAQQKALAGLVKDVEALIRLDSIPP